MNKNDNNEMLSFDELRKQLGMDTEEPPKKQNISSPKTNVAKKEEQKISSTPKEPILDEKEIFNHVTPKRVTDYNNSFVDITDQYVKKETKEEPQPPQTVQEPQKKKFVPSMKSFLTFSVISYP